MKIFSLIARGTPFGFFLLFIPLLSNQIPTSVALAKTQPARTSLTLDGYLRPFYNRYSSYFSEFGDRLQTPGYGKKTFVPPENAREIMSIAMYFSYKAENGDTQARRKIHDSVLAANTEMEGRPSYTQSFEDAIAQFLMVRSMERFSELFSEQEKERVLRDISQRMEDGIRANDTSNRAALSAVYWQYILDQLAHEGYVTTPKEHSRLAQLLANKIQKVIDKDITSNGWYQEGSPARFNPHYHVVTAFSLLAYGEMTNNHEMKQRAHQMTENIRAVSFRNGMIEARMGGRPVGIGSQIYLGAGLLNFSAGKSDFSTYLYYASRGMFFSDPEFPNRLEYHSTEQGTPPEYHDDFAFSNLAELARALPVFSNLSFRYSRILDGYPIVVRDSDMSIINHGDVMWVNQQKIVLRTPESTNIRGFKRPANESFFDNAGTSDVLLRDLSDDDHDGLDKHEESFYGMSSTQSDTDNDGVSDLQEIMLRDDVVATSQGRAPLRYGKKRLNDLKTEKHQSFILYQHLKNYMGKSNAKIIPEKWHSYTNAFIYGRYTVDEIVSNMYHESVPATEWRKTNTYRKLYLEKFSSL